MAPRFRMLATALLVALPLLVRAQETPAAPCPAASVTGSNAAETELLTRASKDPIVGCATLNGTRRTGDVTVAAGDTVRGNLIVLDGTLRIAGTVLGSALALNGAVLLDSSAHVQGDVISAEHGATIAPAGRVDGELRTIDALAAAEPLAIAKPISSTVTSLKRTATWFAILLVLGIGVLINSGDAMQRVTTALHAGFSTNVVVGVLAQMAFLPTLVLTCVLLALTIIGALLIPFAVVAFVVAALGLFVLAGLGTVQMVGLAVTPRRAASTRATQVQALIAGLLLLSVPWFIAAALSAIPLLSAAISTLALGITWLAVTAGLGATLRTRAGTRSHDEPWGIRRPAPSGKQLPVEPPKPEWLTPTPLTGVVAVKRPTTTTGSGSTR